MQNHTIDAGQGFTIVSHGNGWAYTITRETDNKSVFIQDEDARLFYDEYSDLLSDNVTPNTRASRFTWRELLDTMCGVYFD